MGDEATGTTNTETAAAATQGTPAASEAATSQEAPKSALARAEAAMERMEGEAAKDGTAKDDGEDEGSAEKTAEGASSETGKAEPEKKPEPRPSRAMAELVAREQTVRKGERALADQKAAFEREHAGFLDDVKFVRELRSVVAKEGKAGALRMFGIDLRAGIEELSRQTEPTPEDIARKIARDEIEARDKATKETAEREKTEAEQRRQAAEAVTETEFLEKAFAHFNADPSAYPYIAAHSVNGRQIYQWGKAMSEKLGRSVTESEVLEDAEKVLRGRDESARSVLEKRKPTTPAAPAPKTPVPPQAKQKKQIETEDAAEKREVRRPVLTAAQRADLAMKRLNVH
jgi:hypothetical protein